MAESNDPSPPDRRIEFRIGINMGDIVVEDGDIFGDGVNVAARLEGLAQPGGICVSARVQEDVRAASTSPRRHGRAGAQEYFAAGAGIPGGDSYRLGVIAGQIRSSSPREAVDRGIALREHERRPGAGICPA